MPLLDARSEVKPFSYPWAVAAAKRQQQIHWLPDELDMSKDVKQWTMMSEAEIGLATNIMLLFTQSDEEVFKGYGHHLKRIKNPEVQWMLTIFRAQEVNHIFAYSHLMETLGFPDSAFSEFANYPDMVRKIEHMRKIEVNDNYDTAKALGVYGGFMEGLQLFASFIMLMNFQRFGKLKAMGQIVAWSIRDETLHCQGISRLHREFVGEYLSAKERVALADDLRLECLHAVDAEDAFINLAYSKGPVQGLTADDVHLFIRYMADRRMEGLGQPPIFGITKDPQPWFDRVIGGVEHANFFETNPTGYSKSAATGSYDEGWD